MIRRLYNPWTITNEGERAADRHFILPPGREDEPFMIIHWLRLNSRYHRTLMSGECDFFILTKAGLMIDASLKPTFLKVENALMKELIIQCLSMLHSRKLMKKYDFIIADEVQDLFAKGLDHILKYLLKENNALQKGNYYIFYDDSQAYPGTAELGAYIRTRAFGSVLIRNLPSAS